MLVICPHGEDARRLREWLDARRDPVVHVTHVPSLEAGTEILSRTTFQALVFDLATDVVCVLDACRQLRALAPQAAIVLAAGPDQEAIAAQALDEGADHYVLKGPSDGLAVASTVRNALRRVRAQAALREEQARHRSLLALLDDGVAVMDANGSLLEANPALARILGYDHPDDLRALFLRDIYSGPGTPDSLLERLVSAGELPRAEAELLCFSGARVTAMLRASRLRSDTDGTAIYQVICTDVTTERRLEQEARDAEPLVVAGSVAAGAAVEIERLTAAITGAHDLLAEIIGDKHPRRPDLQYLWETTARIAGVSETLRVASRGRSLRRTVLDAASVLERVLPTLQQTFGGGILIRVPPHESVAGQVTAAPGDLDEVIVELASVARALDSEAPVAVTTGPVYLDATFAREHLALAPGHYVAFLVTTSAQSLDTLLAPDWQAEQPLSPEMAERDTALELAKIYRTVNLAGGHVSVRRTRGTGTTFKVYLPRTDTPGRSGTILLVEDEPSIRCGGRQLLELLDYRVIEAADPHEAIWLASRFDGVIDLLIADVVLPGMTGREMAERLTAAGYVTNVLYMSGLLQETLIERASLPPDATFIEKPFTMAQLSERIREVLA